MICFSGDQHRKVFSYTEMYDHLEYMIEFQQALKVTHNTVHVLEMGLKGYWVGGSEVMHG